MLPALYTRVNIKRTELLRIMDQNKWMSMTQITGRLTLLISPECGIKNYRARWKHDIKPTMPLDEQYIKGVRRVVAWWTSGFIKRGYLEKAVAKNRNDPMFRLTKKGISRREKAGITTQ